MTYEEYTRKYGKKNEQKEDEKPKGVTVEGYMQKYHPQRQVETPRVETAPHASFGGMNSGNNGGKKTNPGTMALMQDLDELEAQLEYYKAGADFDWKDSSKRADYDAKVKLYERQIAQKRQEYNLESQENMREFLERVADPQSRQYDPEFSRHTGYTALDNMDALLEEYRQLSGDLGSYDARYAPGQYAANAPAIQKRMQEIEDEMAYAYINDPSSVGGLVSANHYADKGYNKLKPKERAIYNYYYAKKGKAAADRYLSTLQDELNQRVASDVFADMEGETLTEILYSAAAGIDQFAGGIAAISDLDGSYKPKSSTQYVSQMVRQDLADNGPKLPDWMGGSSLAQAAYDFGTTTFNMAPSIIASTAVGLVNPVAGAAVGTGLMSASAAGNAKQEMLNQGYSNDQAWTYGVMVGASEAALQYLLGGVSKLGGGALGKGAMKFLDSMDNAVARIAVKIGKSNAGRVLMNMGSEGAEEYMQEILDPWFRNLTLLEDNELSLITPEAIYSGILGALSGFAFEGATIAGEAATHNAQVRQTGEEILADKNEMDMLERFAKDVMGVADEKTKKGLQKAMDKAANAKPRQQAKRVGQLWEAVQNARGSMSKADIAKAIASKTKPNGEAAVNASMAENIADAIMDLGEGKKLTAYQEHLLEVASDNPLVVEAVQEANNLNQNRIAKITQKVFTDIDKETGISATAALDGTHTYKHGEDGSTYLLSEPDKPVSIKEIASVGKGKLTLRLEDGREVDAKDVQYGTAGMALVYEAVSDMGGRVDAATATKLVKGYDPASGITAQEYAAGMKQAYTYGYYGYTKSEMLGRNTMSSVLTEAQRNFAYNLGRDYRRKSPPSRALSAKTEASQKKQGKVYFRSNNMEISDFRQYAKDADITLKDVQETGIQAMEFLSSALGVDMYVYESYLKDGKRYYIDEYGVEKADAPNGWYDPATGRIYIDLNAGNLGEGTMLFTVAHELTHFIRQWSPEQFTKLADYVLKHSGLKGKGSYLTAQKMANNEKLDYDTAYEEVIADSMESILTSGNVLQEMMADIKTNDRTLWEKICDWFKDMIRKLTGAYEGRKAGSLEGQMAIEGVQADVIRTMEKLYKQALVEAGQSYNSLMSQEENTDTIPVESVTKHSYRSLAEAAGFVAVENEDGTRAFMRNGKKVTKVTVEDIDNSPIGAFINYSLEKKDITKADADRQKEMFAKICTMACQNNDFAMTMQFVGSAVFTGMKANADKQYGTTYDFPSICTKTQAVIDAMSAKMVKLGRGLNSDEIVQLYRDVFASGNPVPCPECYVFSRWIGIGGLLDNISRYQNYYGNMSVAEVAEAYRKMRAEVEAFAKEQNLSFGKAKGALTSKLTKEFNKLTEKVEKQQNQGEKVSKADLKRLEELEPMMNTVKAMTWLENVYFADSSLKKVNPNFRVPNDVLFDLNKGEEFATRYKDAWAFRTTQGAGYGKAITPYAEARLGEGILVTNNTTNTIKGKAQGSLNNYFLQQNGKLDAKAKAALDKARLKQKIQAFLGGQRFQSTSDARYENASDYLLAALEMQAMHGMVQTYTKVDGAVPAFSAWGFSINQSLMPLGGGLDSNGKVRDTSVGGMNRDIAFRNREKYETAGTITIGVNDNHIRAMFQQWVRDFIIPYHASGGKADVVAEFRSIQEGQEKRGKMVRSTDYSRTQGDKVLSDEVLRWQGKTEEEIQRIHDVRAARIAILTGGKPNMSVVRSNRFLSALYDKLHGGEWDGVKVAKSKVESQIFPNEFWDQTVSYEESGKVTRDYLEYCEDLGFLHRFSGLVPKNGILIPVYGYDQNGERVKLTDLAYKYDEDGNKTDQVEDYFWKVLTDRRMYGLDGQYLPQKIVTLNDTEADTVTSFATGNYGRQYDAEASKALTDAIRGVKKIQSEAESSTVRHQARQANEKAKKNIETLTDETVIDLLAYANFGAFDDGTYIPVRKDTPLVLIESTKGRETGEIKNRPFLMKVEKARQAMTPEGEYYGRGKGHGQDEYSIVEIVRNLDKPAYLVYEHENKRYAVIVRYRNGKGKYALVPIDLDKSHSASILNGYSGGTYNIAVTVFNQENLISYFANEDHEQIQIKDAPQGSSGSIVPSLLNGASIDARLTQPKPEVKENPSQKSDKATLKQQRQSESVSNRSLLANALEAAITDETERKRLQEYKQNIAEADEQERKLRDLNAQIKELSFAKGKRDTEKLRQLKDEAVKTKNRLDIYDKWLLRLEAAQPLQDVLNREKQRAYDRAVAEGRKELEKQKLSAEVRHSELLREFREAKAALAERQSDASIMEKEFVRIAKAYEKLEAKADKKASKDKDTITDLKAALREEAKLHREDQKAWEAEFNRLLREYEAADRNIGRLEEKIQHQRQMAYNKADRQKRSAMKQKIKRFKERMIDSLSKTSGASFVPVDLISAMIEVCDLIDTDTELYKADGSINKAQEKRNKTRDKLLALEDAYKKLGDTKDPIYQGEFDKAVADQLQELRQNFAGKSLDEMSLYELGEMYELLRGIEETLQDARKLIGWGEAETVYEATDSILAEQAEIAKSLKNGKRNAAQVARDTSLNLTLSPVRNVERMSGYNQDSVLLKLFKKFEEGIRKKNLFVMEAYKAFEALSSGTEYEDALYKEVGGKRFVDFKGRKFGVSKMQMMQAVLSMEREMANDMHHIEKGGFTFADLDMLRKGRLKDAISAEHSHRVPNATEMVQQFAKELAGDRWAQEYMAAARAFFNGKAKDAINETTIALKHRIVAKDKNYIPFEVDKDFVNREISAENNIQETINSYGMLKDTKNGAPQALIVTGLNNILDRHIELVGNVYGLAVEVRNFNKVWNARSVDGNSTVKNVIGSNWGTDGAKHIEQAVQDIQGRRNRDRSVIYDKIKSGYISSTFLLNLSVVTKQIGSLFSATSMLRWRDPVTQLGNLAYTMANHKRIEAEVDKYTATAWMRRQGLSDAELHSLTTHGKKLLVGRMVDKLPAAVNPGKWISAMDHAVALSLWEFAKRDTAKRTGLTGEELLKATAQFYDEVIENTQSVSDVLHRPEIQKKSNIFAESVAMFKTDLYQMAGNLEVAKGRFFANRNTENAKALGRTIYAAAMSAIWGSLMTTAFALIRYKVNQYRDEEDKDLTRESWLKRQKFGLVGDLAGYLFPMLGGEIVDMIERVEYGGSYAFMDNLVLDTVNDFVDAATKIAASIYEDEMPKASDMKKLVTLALQVMGVPAGNILRINDAIRLHAEDIANGEFLSFEAGVERSAKNHVHKILEALEAGNTSMAEDLYEDAVQELAMRKAGDSVVTDKETKEAASDLRSDLGKRYKDGEVSRENAQRLLAMTGYDEDKIYWTLDEWDYAKTGEDEDYGKFEEFYTAVETGTNLRATVKRYTDNGVEESTLRGRITSHFKPIYTAMTTAQKAGLKGYLLNALEMCGSTRADAEDTLNQWVYEAEHPELDGKVTFSQYKQWQTEGKNYGVSLELFADVAVYRKGSGNGVRSQDEVRKYIESVARDNKTRHRLWCCFYKASTSPWR